MGYEKNQNNNFLTRNVLLEKTLIVKLKQKFFVLENNLEDDVFEQPSCFLHAWYIEPIYQNREFIVRHATKKEFEDMKNSIIFGNLFKQRCSYEGFYVIVGERCKDLFLGKVDCKKIS